MYAWKRGGDAARIWWELFFVCVFYHMRQRICGRVDLTGRMGPRKKWNSSIEAKERKTFFKEIARDGKDWNVLLVKEINNPQMKV